MDYVENRMVVDEWWRDIEMEPEEPDGYYDQWGTFVEKDYLLEVALEEVNNDGITRDRFVEKVLDFIEANKEATKQFLKWYYPEYGKDD